MILKGWWMGVQQIVDHRKTFWLGKKNVALFRQFWSPGSWQ